MSDNAVTIVLQAVDNKFIRCADVSFQTTALVLDIVFDSEWSALCFVHGYVPKQMTTCSFVLTELTITHQVDHRYSFAKSYMPIFMKTSPT